MGGRCLEGLEPRNCLAGLLDVRAPMRVPAWLLDAFGGTLVRNARLGEVDLDA